MSPNVIHPTAQRYVRFASFLSDGFITAIVVNPPESKLAKCTFVHCTLGNCITAIQAEPTQPKKISFCTVELKIPLANKFSMVRTSFVKSKPPCNTQSSN